MLFIIAVTVTTVTITNVAITTVIIATVTITLPHTVPPLEVRILGRREGPYSEGQQYKLVCESAGSRPSATITWWKDGMLMTDTRNQVSQGEGREVKAGGESCWYEKVFQEGNVSRSTLHLTPTLADHDTYISLPRRQPPGDDGGDGGRHQTQRLL
ncbi:hypothetical protein GWK47_013176 [Chionoecetes opilio]|uniref:Ig-like domain-containing protein n=1 Tax=Chionoecetes opilio TaxID=41210 RepID=A0A8J4XWC0_CHIOP|nr:hypothetical protein GWK47_013176 [Chionoecetes opilio]